MIYIFDFLDSDQGCNQGFDPTSIPKLYHCSFLDLIQALIMSFIPDYPDPDSGLDTQFDPGFNPRLYH